MDWKSKYALGSLLLYVLSTGYVVYLAFQQVDDRAVWNALLWIIILFASFNVVSRAFDQDSGDRGIYLFTLASAQTVILAKTIYSALLMMAVALLSFLVYSFFLPLQNSESIDLGLFILGILLGSAGLATILSLIAGISWKSGNRSGMIAILGFPLILPLLLATMRYSEQVIQGATWQVLWPFAAAIFLVSVIGATLGYILFPYIWRE